MRHPITVRRALRRSLLRHLGGQAAAGIRVILDDGAVRLTGTVRTDAERRAAERAARGVAGVTRITIRIAVTAASIPAGTPTHSLTALARWCAP